MSITHGFRDRAARRVADQRGMTLVELLVAMSISLVITTMILVSWFALSGSYANTARRAKTSDVARFAMARMEREVRDVEQPPASVSEVAVVRARPYFVELYTTFNKAGNQFATVLPRRVMYRLYSNGELWRFQDTDASGAPGYGTIEGVNDTIDSGFDLSERTTGEGGQLMASNVVNETTPAGSPTPVFTYIYFNPDGTLAYTSDLRGTTNRALIRAVEINLLLDMNPGKSPVYTHLRTTAQLRNTR
jgi:prepilin-type N-terminal cleavage/methylation domain-containing protein